MPGPIDSIVSVTIQANNATPTVPNFGTPAILAYHTYNTDYIRTYQNLAGMVADGFSTTESAYLMAQSILSQTPTVPSFKVIRGTTSVVQAITFLVVDHTQNDSVGFTITDASGVAHDCHITVGASQSAIQVATSIAAVSVTGATLANSGTATVTLTVNASGKVWYVSNVLGGTFLDTTPTASPATDLTAALNVDSAWYGISGEHQDATNIAAVAAWAETNKKFHAYTTADTNNLSASSGIGNTLKTSAYAYSFGQYSGTPISYGATALMGQRFTANPGSDTWAFKTLAGVAVDALTPTQITNLQGNKLNYYISVAGINITQVGVNASGLYADLRRGIDALTAQIQIQIYALLAALPKVPYDPRGIAMLGGEVRSALAQFTASANVPAALLRSDPGFQATVILPDISTIPTTDRTARVLKQLNFVAYGQNAIQTVQINGTITI